MVGWRNDNGAKSIMESEMQPLKGLLAREAGITFLNSIAEVREAVGFLRYYADQARSFANNMLAVAKGNNRLKPGQGPGH